MITKKMREFLENYDESRKKLPSRKRVKDYVYFIRIQAHITKELNQFLWLCKHHPEIFKYTPQHVNDYGHVVTRSMYDIEGKRRLKILLQCVMVLMRSDIELSLPEPKEEVLKHG